jgi:hypothetical protein
MERVDAEVRRELGRFGPHEGDTHADTIVAVVRIWPRAVGDTIARNAWPARIGRDGTLHVSTVSATWAFELGRLAPTILAQLGAELGAGAPTMLKFAPGAVPEAAAGPPEAGHPRAPAPSVEQRAEAAELAAEIEDEELRRLVARAAAASLARGRPGPTDDRCF